MGRPTNASKTQENYLKEQFQQMAQVLNKLEDVCKKTSIEQKEDFTGTIGLLVGKCMVRFDNITSELKIFEDE